MSIIFRGEPDLSFQALQKFILDLDLISSRLNSFQLNTVFIAI